MVLRLKALESRVFQGKNPQFRARFSWAGGFEHVQSLWFGVWAVLLLRV